MQPVLIPGIAFTLDSFNLAVLVGLFISSIKPLIEQAPGLHPDDPAHDTALRVLAYALNLALILAAEASVGRLAWSLVLGYAITALEQTAGGHLGYQVVTKTARAITTATGSVPLVDAATNAPFSAEQITAASAAVANALATTTAKKP